MDGRWAVPLLLLVALAGCLEGDASWDERPLRAGEWWTLSTRNVGNGTFTDHTSGETEAFEHDESAIWKEEVLATDLPSAVGPLELVRRVVSLPHGGQSERLFAYEPAGFDTIPLLWWKAQACDGETVCVPPLAGRLIPGVQMPEDPALPFPLHVGKAWSRDIGEENLTVLEHGKVLGTSRFVVGNETIDVLEIRIWLTFPDEEGLEALFLEDAPPGSTMSFRYDLDVLVAYAPDHGVFLRSEGTVEGVLSIDVPGDASFTERFFERFTAEVTAMGARPAPVLADVVDGMDLPDAPPDMHPPTGAAGAVILPHPERLEVGKPWTFAGAPTGDAAEGLEWSLRPGLPQEQQDAVASHAGATFAHTFALPGAYTLDLQALDGDGAPVGRSAESLLLVDQRVTFEGACAVAVVPFLLGEDTSCEGVTFPLLPQAYRVKAEATYPTEHSLLPCPYLALYGDGEEQFRTYALIRPGGIGMDTLTLPPEKATGMVEHEVRWVPGTSAGGPVQYTVDILALGYGSFSGEPGNDC